MGVDLNTYVLGCTAQPHCLAMQPDQIGDWSDVLISPRDDICSGNIMILNEGRGVRCPLHIAALQILKQRCWSQKPQNALNVIVVSVRTIPGMSNNRDDRKCPTSSSIGI